MQPEERQKRIEEYLLKAEFASLEELAIQVDASLSTVRRDLDLLASQGHIRRTHGGARVIAPKSDEFAFSSRDTLQLAEKEAIGRTCAHLIQPGQSVIIDAGTTAFHAARHLDGQTLQIITNSLPVANLFASAQQIEVVVSGGVIYPRLGVLVGPLAVDAFSKIHADVAIMSGGGITLDGVTNSHALLIDIQQAMIRAAGKVIFCLDSSKLGRRSVAHLCDLTSIDAIVTDSAAPPELINALRARGVEVLVVALSIAPPAPAPLAPLPIPVETTKPPKPPKPSKPIKRPRRPLIRASVAPHTPAPQPSTESSDSRMGWD